MLGREKDRYLEEQENPNMNEAHDMMRAGAVCKVRKGQRTGGRIPRQQRRIPEVQGGQAGAAATPVTPVKALQTLQDNGGVVGWKYPGTAPAQVAIGVAIRAPLMRGRMPSSPSIVGHWEATHMMAAKGVDQFQTDEEEKHDGRRRSGCPTPGEIGTMKHPEQRSAQSGRIRTADEAVGITVYHTGVGVSGT